MNKIIIEEISVSGCVECREFKEFWESIKDQFPQVEMRHIDATSEEGQQFVQKYFIMSAPGIIINGELFSTGGFDKKEFIEKLRGLNKS